MSNAGRTTIERNLLLSSALARLYAISMSLLAARHRIVTRIVRFIAGRVRVIGWRHIEFGRNVAIGTGSFLNVNSRHGSQKNLVFGDNCFIGRNNFISVGKAVRIGPYCITAEGCSLIGATHTPDPTRPYLVAGVFPVDEIVVGVNCFFGYGASILGNVTIGHGCIIGAHSLVRADIPPFSIAVGNPARVVKRFDFASRQWRTDWEGRELHHPTEEEYLTSLRESHPWPVLPISAATSGFGDI
jgi:acetyltransferase-like isoleucine patch superfamily enzyme